MGNNKRKRGYAHTALVSKSGNEGDGLFDLMGRFVRGLPGAEQAEEQLGNIERRVLSELKQRMDRASGPRALPAPSPGVSASHASAAYAPASATSPSLLSVPAQQLMQDLLERAEEQSVEQAQGYLYAMMLRELVPDEARLLGALSDGEPHPLVHVALGSAIGGTPRRIADNFSNLGKTAALKLKEYTPSYITHLRNLDLLETGPEDKEFEIKYQILESDRVTRQAAEYAEKHSGATSSVKYLRRTIRISPLGKDLWDYCQQGLPPADE